MLPRTLDLTIAHVHALVPGGVPEDSRLEYKSAVVGPKDGDKAEFLADVASFANAAGGDIIFGVAERSGVPVAVDGLPGVDPDAEILRMTQIINAGIEPRLVVQMKALVGEKGPVIVVRVAKYWAGLVMIKFGGAQRFVGRRNTGKVVLDVHEIRAGFVGGADLSERARRFYDERIVRIRFGDAPVSLKEDAAAVLHLIPADAFVPGRQIDLHAARASGRLPALDLAPTSPRYSIDGLVGRSEQGYTILYRSGIAEMVSARLASEPVPSTAFVEDVLDAVTHYVGIAQTAGVDPPIFAFAHLFGVKGKNLAVRTEYGGSGYYLSEFDRDVVALPDVVIESYEQTRLQLFRPMFDGLWQAAGRARCEDYDSNGNLKTR